MDVTTLKDVEEFLKKMSENNPPKTEEEFMTLLDEAIHQLRAMGKITRDGDIQYIKNIFAKRWRFFVDRSN